MKTLVTGGGGFLGRAIVEQLLLRGDDVTVFARGNYPALEAQGAALIRGDLQDAAAVSQACAGVDAVFHVAANAHYWGSWESFYGPNVTGTQNVIAACRRHAIPKLIFTSTPSVVANGQNRSGVDESTPYPERYQSYYAHTKMLAEKLVLNANCPELLTVALRPHVIFGPRDTQIIPRLVARARAGKLFRVGDGRNKLDVTYIDDAARAHLQAADALRPGSAAAGSAYFISQDEPVNLWDFVNDLLVRLDIPPVERAIPLGAARAVGGVLEFIYRTFRLSGEPRLTRFLADELALDHYYNISRAKRDLGYRPQLTIEQAVQKTVAYFRNQRVGSGR
ncbi:MAG: NAD-dependent epimerase/dehydratase family protein [Chloroflexi bacterium]|nr:MAG: NAD-dependent epimerase/dehydratase family protein [Chloroflexota bacterium]